jgi:hypothetical protein
MASPLKQGPKILFLSGTGTYNEQRGLLKSACNQFRSCFSSILEMKKP